MKIKQLTIPVPAFPKISTMLLILVAAALSLLTACSKESSPPNSEQIDDSKSYAKAEIHFITDDKKVPFSAEGYGALGAVLPEEGQTVLVFRDADEPMFFSFYVNHIEEGTYSHADGTLSGGGIFMADSTVERIYLIGEDNLGFPDDIIDGQMEITITSITDDFIKGTFTTKMIMNVYSFEGGVLQVTEVKEAVVNNGVFNCMRVDPSMIPR